MSKTFFNSMLVIILILIVLINSVLALILFKGAGFKLWWEKPDSVKNIEVVEASPKKTEINYNKININIEKGILEVFENMYVKERKADKFVKIQISKTASF